MGISWKTQNQIVRCRLKDVAIVQTCIISEKSRKQMTWRHFGQVEYRLEASISANPAYSDIAWSDIAITPSEAPKDSDYRDLRRIHSNVNSSALLKDH